MKLFDVLTDEAKDCLLRKSVIDLVRIVSRAVPDPHRPGNRTGMAIVTGSGTEFAGGLRSTRAVHTLLRRVSRYTEKDLSRWTREEVLVALNRRRKEVDLLKRGKFGGQTLKCLTDPRHTVIQSIIQATKPEVAIWGLAWTAAMDDDGKMVVDCEEHYFSTAIDDVTRENIRKRMRRVNNVVGREVLRLLGGE